MLPHLPGHLASRILPGAYPGAAFGAALRRHRRAAAVLGVRDEKVVIRGSSARVGERE